MDTSTLTSEVFWNSEVSHVMLHELLDGGGQEGVSDTIIKQLPGHLFFRTSGSSGTPKWVAISKVAMLASAAAVNDHLRIEKYERWFNALPLFHVGGMGIMARAFLLQSEVIFFNKKWNAKRFCEAFAASEAHWTSLVPTQVIDIVRAGLRAPREHRGVIVGGGALDINTNEKAVELGWRVLQSYGMSEAGSQIATAQQPGGKMQLMDHVEVRLVDQKLHWRGASKYSGYIINEELKEAGDWVKTNDRVLIEGRELSFVSRADRMVKILGELVDVDLLEAKIAKHADQEVVLVVRGDERRGGVLVPMVEQAPSVQLVEWLRSFSGLETLAPLVHRKFPRSALGKIQRGGL